MLAERWAIYIDIEGFSALYETDNGVIHALGDIMTGLLDVSEKVFPESPDRVFAYQAGDGFVISGEFNRESLEVPVALTIALMRHVAARGRYTAAALGEGSFAGITGMYPRRVTDNAENDGLVVRMGGSLMTLFPVMGTSFIRAAGIQKRKPKGPLFLVKKEVVHRLPQGVITTEAPDDCISIDWTRSESPLLSRIQKEAGLRAPSAGEMHYRLQRYVREHKLPSEWSHSVSHYLGVAL